MAGGLVHFEIPAAEWERAKSFWGSLLGWQFSAWGGDVQYALAQPAEGPGGGLYPTEASERGLKVYFGVDDIHAALARVRELGGTVEVSASPIPGTGWCGMCIDTEGNSFGLFQHDESVSSPS